MDLETDGERGGDGGGPLRRRLLRRQPPVLLRNRDTLASGGETPINLHKEAVLLLSGKLLINVEAYNIRDVDIPPH